MPFVGCCALVYFWTLRFSRIGDFYTLRLGFFGNLDLRIIVAPNPVREYVTVTFPGDSVSELSVINSQGEIVMREKLKESVTSLPVEGLSPGIYLVSVKSSGQIYNRKIVVE